MPAWIVRSLALLCVLTFAAIVASRSVRETLCCADDALAATAAKNLAFGNGYQTLSVTRLGGLHAGNFDYSHPPVIEPTLGIGPALVLPVALAIRVAGNRDWVPGATSAALIAMLLLAFRYIAAATLASRSRADLATLALVVFAGAFTASRIDHWSAMLGEIPAALWTAVGLGLAFRAERTSVAILAGICLGLAIRTKLLVTPAVVLPLLGLVRRGGGHGRSCEFRLASQSPCSVSRSWRSPSKAGTASSI